MRIHLKSILTGAPHPAGPEAGMVTYKPKPGGYSYAIQTAEGCLGILMSSQGEDVTELLVWDWRTGTLRLVRLSTRFSLEASRFGRRSDKK